MAEEDNNLDQNNGAEEKNRKIRLQKKLKQARAVSDKMNAENLKKAASDKLKKEAEKMAKKGAARIIAWACGATGFGLPLTHGVRSVQAIGGNLMNARIIPKLDGFGDKAWYEFINWFLLSALLGIAVILLLAVVVLAALPYIALPMAIKLLGQAIVDMIF